MTSLLIAGALTVAMDGGAASAGPNEVSIEADNVDIRFDPARSSTVTAACSEVGHVQFLQMWAVYPDRWVVVTPGQLRARDRWLDATISDIGFAVDTCRRADPVYQDPELRGDATRPARMSDAPNLQASELPPYHPETNPSGWTKMVWRFQTYAYCAQGEARGTFYEGVAWSWEIDSQHVVQGDGRGAASFTADLPPSAAARAPIQQAFTRYLAAPQHPVVCGV